MLHDSCRETRNFLQDFSCKYFYTNIAFVFVFEEPYLFLAQTQVNKILFLNRRYSETVNSLANCTHILMAHL